MEAPLSEQRLASLFATSSTGALLLTEAAAGGLPEEAVPATPGLYAGTLYDGAFGDGIGKVGPPTAPACVDSLAALSRQNTADDLES